MDNFLSIFNISPETATLPERGTAVFQVTFKPIKESYYFYQQV
jgi:hypothetical protein